MSGEMKIIVCPRQNGKTTQAVEWVKADPTRVLLVRTIAEALRIMNRHGLTEHQVMTYAQWRGESRRGVTVGVDNADDVLRSVIGHRNSLALLTINGEPTSGRGRWIWVPDDAS